MRTLTFLKEGALRLLKNQFSAALLLLSILTTSIVHAQVSVTATAGTTGPTAYTTLKGAFDAVNAGTHQGVITIAITGNTTETATAALNASGSGSASYTAVSIQPSGGGARTISGTIAAALINLNGADNVNINGLNSGGNSLTISNTNTATTANTIQFIADATNNTVQNCTIQGVGPGLVQGIISFLTGTTTGNDNNTITNNIITSGATVAANAIYSAGSSVAIDNSGITISNNSIADYYHSSNNSNGIYIASASSAWSITGNRFYQTATRTSTAAGCVVKAIQIVTASGINYTISNNIIGYANASGTGTTTYAGAGYNLRYTAIDVTVGTSTASNIQGNTITNISVTGSNSGGSNVNPVFGGIIIEAGSVNVGTISANTIGSSTGTGSIVASSSSNGFIVNGIYSTSAGTVNIQNNIIGSISATGSGATVAPVLSGIQVAGAGVYTISSNSIGSSSTANSIQAGVSATTTVTSSLYGIYSSATGTPLNITSNTVSNLRQYSSGTSSLLYAIYSTGAATTLNITGNTVTSNTNTAGALYGIYNSGTGTGTYTISSNQVSSNTNAGIGTSYGIYGGAPTTLVMNTNNVYSNSMTGASGILYCMSAGTTQYTLNGNNIYSNGFTATSGTSSSTLYGFYDGASPTSETITNNNIYSLSIAGSNTSAGNLITGIGSNTAAGTKNWSGNLIYSLSFTNSSTGTATVNGISSALSTTITIAKNKIYDLSAAGTTSLVSGILVSSTSASATVNIHNNYIGDLKAPSGSNGTTDVIRAINITATTATTSFNVFYNTIYLNASGGTNFTTSGIFHTISTTATTTALSLSNNIIVNNSTPSGTGLTIAYRRSGGLANNLANYASTSDNNLFYAGTPGATRLIYYDGTSSAQTLSAYKSGVFTAGTIAPRDANSITENPPFLSTTGSSSNFLHIDPSVATLIESGAVSPSVTTYSTDYDGDIRQGSSGYTGTGTAPDIGADEGEFLAAKPSITLNSITPNTAQCTATARAISVNVTTPSGTITGVTITFNNGTATGPVAMTNTSGSTWTYTIPAASPANTTVAWSITATNSASLTNTYTGATYQDAQNTGITATATATPSSICAGTATSLSVALARSGNATIGTGVGTNSTSSAVGAWFGTWFGNGHAQILILASELTAAGLRAGNLTGLNIPITSTGSPTTLNNYTIKIGASSATAITTFQAPTFTTVWGPTNFTPSVGTNSFTFTTPFNWNGTSNIIIDYCYANSVTGSTSAVNTFTTTAFGSFVNYNADGVGGAGACGTTTVSNTSSNRPNFVLVGNTAPAPTAFDWSDGSGTVGTTNPLSQSPTTSTSYTCTATVGGCPVVSNTVPVTVTTVSAPTANVSSSSQCGSAIPTVSVSGTSANMRWYSADYPGGTLLQTGGLTYGTAISSTTTFYVAQVSGSCESTTRTPLTVTVSSADALSASASSTSICLGASIDLSTSQTGSTNTYALTWTASPVSGSGIGGGGTSGSLSPSVTTVTPTAPGTYIYTITGVDGSCTATNTVSVTVGDAPSISTGPSSVSIAAGTNTSFTVVASNTPTSYLWEVNTGSGWTTVTNGGVYSNATTATLNITGASYSMNGYQYRVTASNGCGSSSVSSTATLTVTLVYCTPSSTGSATYINSFSTSSGITNISNLTTGYTTGGYINYSATLSASQYQNTAITCNITYVGGTAGLGIWVDWNNNGSFLDAGENVYNTIGCVATGTYNPSFTIPSSQPAGNYRMRVVVDYIGCTPTPCAIAGTRGEVEDYTLTVVVPPTPTITSLGTASGCTGSTITINGTNFIGITAANVKIGGTAVTSITSFTSTQIIAVIGSGTTGNVTVTTGGGTATSPGTFTVLSLPANPPAPTSNSPQCTSPGVTLTATGSAPGGETWYWQTTASGTTINAGVNDQPTYNVTTSGTYYIRSYNGTCWSTGAGSLAVTVNTVPAASVTPTPANSATGVCYAGVGAITTVSWAATAGATSYDIYFGAGSVPGTLTANVTTNSWTISPALAASTTYYWKVVAKNACGDAVGSSTWSFTTNNVPCTCTSVPTSNDGNGITGVTVGSATFAVADVTYFNYTSAIPDLTTGTTVTSSVTFATGYTYDTHIWIDLNDDGVFDNTTEKVFTGVSSATNPTTLNTSFALGSGAALGLHKMRIGTADNGQATPTPCYSSTYGVTIDLVVNVVAPVGCTGTPTGGTVTVTPSEGAPSSTYAVSATGYTVGLGITYLWQSNTNGAGWVDIGTASSTYASLTGLTAPAFGTVIQYRLLVTCTNSSQSAYSSIGTFTSGYCIPSGSNGSYWITNFTTTTGITNINNTSGAGVGGYSNFTAQSCSQYQGSSINLSISTNTSTHYFYVWVDWNNDGDFIDAGEAIVSTSSFTASYTGSYTIPLTQAAGSYRMRIANNWSVTTLTSCGSAPYGEYEDYTFTVVVLPACTGTPSAGTLAYSGGTLCANVGSATITNSGYTTGFSGLTYQWLSSNDNFATDTSSVSGGSNPATLSTGALTATTSYLVRAFCSNSGIYSYSNKITVTVNAPAITTTVPATRCDAGTLTISATGTSGSTIRWYSAATGGTLLQTGTAGSGADTYTTVSLPYTSNNTYYVEALNGTCTSTPRTAVSANVVPPTTNPTISPLPTIAICRDSILTLNASGSTVATTTLLYEGFEGTFPPSTFNFNTNGDGDYFNSSSYYSEGSKSVGLYSETDYWWWWGFYGEAGNVNMVQATPIDLSSYLDAKLTFYHICATEDGYDFGIVQYNDGTGWQNFPSSAYTGSATLADANGNSSTTDQIAFDKASYTDWDATFTDDYYDYLDLGATGYNPGNSSSLWKRESIDLTPFKTNNFRIRFRYTFDDVTDYYSWLIDSIAITGNQAIKYAWSPNTGLYTNAAATTAYDSLTTANAATVYAKPTATTTYKAIAYTGPAPATCSGNASVTVNVSQKPTATIDAARPYVCDATAQLSVSSVTPPTATFNWTKASGTGSASASGNPVTVSGLSGTTVYNVLASEGACVDVPLGTSTVVTPTTSTTIATSPSPGVSVCNYCVYQDGNTKTYYNSTDGKLIASITDESSNSASLGETEVCFKVESAPGTVVDNLGNTQPYLQRIWTINPVAGSTATVTLYFTDAELAALQAAANSGAYQFSGLGSLGITKYSNGGTAYTPNYTPPASSGGVIVPAAFSSYGTDYQAQFQVSSFSTFYLHPLLYPFGALPVELVAFTGWNAGAENQLQWKTASELNTKKFVVEKRTDGGSFAYMGELPAAGTSNQLKTYGLTDANPVVGNNYYRLKIIDNDGTFSYSNVINVPIGDAVKNGFNRVYPNPTGGMLNVEIQSTSAYNTKISVYDVLGAVVFEQNKSMLRGVNLLQFDFSSFAKGSYIINFADNNGKTHITKFVKD
ncbi:MAG: GEVED domain-containing protein [Chitinophagales bacterium]